MCIFFTLSAAMLLTAAPAHKEPSMLSRAAYDDSLNLLIIYGHTTSISTAWMTLFVMVVINAALFAVSTAMLGLAAGPSSRHATVAFTGGLVRPSATHATVASTGGLLSCQATRAVEVGTPTYSKKPSGSCLDFETDVPCDSWQLDARFASR